MNLSDKLKLPQQIMEKICSKYNAPVRLHKGITKRKGMQNVWVRNHLLDQILLPHKAISLTLASLAFQGRIRVVSVVITSPPRVKRCFHLECTRSWDDSCCGVFSPSSGWCWKFSFSVALITQKRACFVLELSQTFAPGKRKKAKMRRISSGRVWKAAE